MSDDGLVELPHPGLTADTLFSAVGPAHPFAPTIEALREAVSTEPVWPGTRQERISELKGVRSSTGFDLLRVYCSHQTWHPSPDEPFRAATLHWTGGSRNASWAHLAEEPYLGDVQSLMQHPTGSVEVLRYVPTRRFTVAAGEVVTKVKRRTRLIDSVKRARAVAAAASARGSEVQVPAIVDVDLDRWAYGQLRVEGTAMSQTDRSELIMVLAEAGNVHADFHALHAPGLPVSADDVAIAAAIEGDVGWTAFFRPDLTDQLARVRHVLLTSRPEPDPQALGTCHGDLVPSHLLAGPKGWSVIDLDLAHRGDRYRDLALFLTGLAGDVEALADGIAAPGLLAAAESAYLSGYQQREGRVLDGRRLAWHRGAAQVRALALMFTKDAVRPAAVERIMADLDDTMRALSSPRRVTS